MEAPIAVGYAPLHQLPKTPPQRHLQGRHARVSHARTGTLPASHAVRSETTCASCTQRTHVRRCAGLTIFRMQSCRLVLQKFRSATSCLRFRFSSRSCRSFRISGLEFVKLFLPPVNRLPRHQELVAALHDGRTDLGLPRAFEICSGPY
jgi:hypothetical protein